MTGRYTSVEEALHSQLVEARMVTAATAVIAKLGNEAWNNNRINLNDRGGRKRPHYKTDTASRQWWRDIGRAGAQSLSLQLEALGDQVRPPYRVVVYYAHRNLTDRDSVNVTPVTKAIVDGLVWGGLLPNDNNKWVVGQDSRLLKTDGYQVEIIVQLLATQNLKET